MLSQSVMCCAPIHSCMFLIDKQWYLAPSAAVAHAWPLWHFHRVILCIVSSGLSLTLNADCDGSYLTSTCDTLMPPQVSSEHEVRKSEFRKWLCFSVPIQLEPQFACLYNRTTTHLLVFSWRSEAVNTCKKLYPVNGLISTTVSDMA